MGNQASSRKSTLDVVSNAVVDVMAKFASECANDANFSQNMTDIVCSGPIRQSMNISSKFKCFQTTTVDASFASMIAAKISDELKKSQDGQNIGISVDVSDDVSKQIADIAMSIDYQQISSCFNSISARQNMQRIQCGDAGIEQDLTINVIADCIQSNAATMKAINDLDTTLDKSEQVSVLGSVNSTTIIIIVIACVIAGALYLMYK